jgi:hypothetical protein
MSYCDTALELFAFAADFVPGLPAYTALAWPLPLNTELLLVVIAFAGAFAVDAPEKQVVPGAPG